MVSTLSDPSLAFLVSFRPSFADFRILFFRPFFFPSSRASRFRQDLVVDSFLRSVE